MAFVMKLLLMSSIKIEGDLSEFTPIKNQVTIVSSPFSTAEGGLDFTNIDNQIVINDVNTFKSSFEIQGKTFNNVIVLSIRSSGR